MANQRVKECDRIKAMKNELAKLGVTCRELVNITQHFVFTIHRLFDILITL